MRRKYALSLDPTIFPKKMKTTVINGQQMATTADIARYLFTLHTHVACTFQALRFLLTQTGIQDLNDLATQYDCEDINLTLQDNIDLHSLDDGFLIDQFSYALTLRCLERSGVLEPMRELLQQRQEVA